MAHLTPEIPSRPNWNYHPLEFNVRARSIDSDLARRIAVGLSQYHQVGFVRHGPSYLARPAEHTGIGAARLDGVWAVVSANGKDCLLSHDGHFDLPQQKTLLSDLDLVVVEGGMEGTAPLVVELESDGSGLDALSAYPGKILACVGSRRPDRVPAGGVPWFPPYDDDGIVDLCLDYAASVCRHRALWALVVGPTDSHSGRDVVRILSDRCERVLRFDAPPDGLEPIETGWPRLGILGGLLSVQELGPDAAILMVHTANSETPDLLEKLLELRDPLRSATAFRETDSHLPNPKLSIWEPKSRLRIFQALAAGISCPQRILTHSRIQLLDKVDSSLP